MAMDIRILRDYRIEMGVLFPKQLLAIFQIFMVLSQGVGSPVWMPQFLSGGQGRSIRHLPCVSRRTGEQGVCMFAYTCLKSNGTHLGTCIDRFYFGSCCKLGDGDDLLEDTNFPVINNNQVTYPGEVNTNKVQTIVETTTSGVKIAATDKLGTTDKTIIDLAQHLATETYFLPSSTDKLFVPVQTAKPNKTAGMGTTVLFTFFGDKRPSTTLKTPTTTQPYLLSTFQVVNSSPTKAPPLKYPIVTFPSTTSEIVSTWTPVREEVTTPSSIKINATVTTTKKPSKPVKPFSTTRKPTTRRPATKPPATTFFTGAKITTPKPTTPKKPPQPTKKPSAKPPTVKPTSARPVTVRITTAKPVTNLPQKTSTVRYPIFGTSEVVFTKPGSTLQTAGYGITTFRPDLSSSDLTKHPSESGVTTFSYASEDTTSTPLETTTSRFETTSTFNNEVSIPDKVGGTAEAQEENTNVIYQQIGSTLRPAVTSPKPVNASVPFFPEYGSSQGPTHWVEMVQTSMKPVVSTSTAAAVTTKRPTLTTLFQGLNVSDYTQVCGRRIYPQARVVGGEKSTFGKWPWQISLRQWRTSTYLHKCGAALLNENWAITAAHCVENVPPSDLLLRLGEHDLSTEDEPFGFQERRVQIVASHPQFDPRTFEYDLALLRFYEPVKFQPNIIPVCVPEDNTNFVGQTAYVTGWGRLYEDGPLPSVLQEVSVPVINNTLCENMYRSAGYIEHIPEIFICAGWKKGGFDSCEGDSGGPMVIQRPDKRWLLAGVISWGIGCAEPNQPGVYTRISEFREWIHQILQF